MATTNINGTPLEQCDPQTGYNQRSGYCEWLPEDAGRHQVCAEMTGPRALDYLRFTREHTSNKGLADHISRTKPKRWCLCESRYQEAVRHRKAPRVFEAGTNSKVSHYGPPGTPCRVQSPRLVVGCCGLESSQTDAQYGRTATPRPNTVWGDRL